MIATAHPTPAAARPDLVGLLPEEAEPVLREHFTGRGQPAYRVGQVLRWLYERGAAGFAEMSDLPQAERAALAEAFSFTAPEPAKISRSVDGTAKHLWRLADGELIESVLIPTPTRLTLCISSQAGCAMACTFCATGWAGYRRQLTPGEIVAQFRGARRWAQENGYDDITNIVFMGMGEPLMNPKAVFPTLAILNRGYKFGARRITISTVGVVPGILRLAEMPEQYRLAVSLHAPNHELRQKLIPLEKKYDIDELLEALRRFDAAGGKRITFEYVMIDGVTDLPELADELARVIREFNAFVNLIPFNPIPGTEWKPSRRARLDLFVDRLGRHGISAAVRESRGSDIAAACGQLRAEVTQGRTPVQMGSL
ncbi:MAG TPA: 23S rRNA (adenine(2503)-C(2))-methyltransferase RlmN [Longimicrobium sp.]|jgi:23S rRNA (adenine2503-C2)-methyltransferase|uniref:23S rRNA (adenine(2503)-C(2))-methyltransferase RlmN n=1 Tax=Longimicrobium sp. TaxID=2029185 RepID=UPI002ED79406